MTQKDYKMLAGVVKHTERDNNNNLILSDLLERLAANLSYDNPRFDAERFFEACE